MTEPLRTTDELTDALRADPPVLDDVRRARMERALLEGSGSEDAAPKPRRSPKTFVGGVVVGLAAAAAIGLVVWRANVVVPEDTVAAATEPAVFEALRDGLPVRRGAFAEGEAVLTAEGQLVRVRFGGEAHARSTVEVAPESRARFTEIVGDRHEIELTRGRVRVEFHPERPGAQHFAVETANARVEVVGTVFSVEVDGAGTHVEVTEGVVRVLPRSGGQRLVSAGESTTVAESDSNREANVELPRDDDESAAETLAAADVASALLGRQQPLLRVDDPTPLPEPSEAVVETADEGSLPVQADEGGRATAPSGPPLADDVRFDLAMRYIDQGEYGRARHELLAIVRSTRVRVTRARAWTDIATTYAREDDHRQAAEAYRRAYRAAPGTSASHNALFALGQMRLSLNESDAAAQVFREYVFVAPEGALSSRARRSLCTLGDRAYCP